MRRPEKIAARRGARRAGQALALLAAAPVAATAGDQSLTGSVSQTLLADTNLQLDSNASDGGDGALGSITRLNLNYANRTPTAALSLGTGFNYSAYTNDTNDNIAGLFPNLSGAYRITRPTQSLGFTFNASVRPVDYFTNTGLTIGDPLIPGDDTGEEPDGEEPTDGELPPEPDTEDPIGTPESRREQAEALRVTVSAGVNYNRRLTSTASSSFNFRATRRDFIDDTFDFYTPYTNFGAGLGFNQQLTRPANFGLSADANVYLSDGDDNRRTYTISLLPRLNYNESPALSYNFSVGPSLSYTSVDSGSGSDSQFSPGVAGGAGISYTDQVIRLSANLSQRVVPDDEGVAVNRTGLTFSYSQRVSATDRLNARAGASYRTALYGDDTSNYQSNVTFSTLASYSRTINSRSSADVRASAIFQNDEGGNDTTIGLGTGYSYRLTEETRFNVGYEFRIRQGDNDEDSHRVSLTLSRAFTLLP